MKLNDTNTKCLAFIIIILLFANINLLWDRDDKEPDGSEPSVQVKEHRREHITGTPSASYSTGATRAVRNYLEDLNAQYNWIDISQTGTSIFLDDDDYREVNMGLTFNFYDTPFTSCRISSNGMIVFGNTSDPWEYENVQFPSNVYSYYMAPLWDDLYPPEGGTICYKKLTNPERFVVSYLGVPHIDDWGGGGIGNTFQVIMDASTGMITFNYQNLWGQNSPTVGLNMGDGTHFNMPFFNQNPPGLPRSLKFFITIPPVPDGMALRSANGYRNICYTEFQPYTLGINLTTYEGLNDISDLKIKLDYNTTNITLGFNGTYNKFYKNGDPEDHIHLLDTSSYRNDGIDKWWLYFNVTFNFTFPHEDKIDCLVRTSGKCGISLDYWFSNVFRVENDLMFQGIPSFEGEFQGVLNENDWIRGGEKISVSGLRVVYQDSADVVPADEHYDIKVFDKAGNHWWDNESSGEEVALNITARDESDTGEEYTITIENIPDAGVCAMDLIFPIKIDADDPEPPRNLLCHHKNFKNDETEYTNGTTAFVTWDAVEDTHSGLKGYYLSQLDNSGTQNGTFIEDTIKAVDNLKEGPAPVYVWCIDNVGNIGEASFSEIMVDRTGPVFTNLTPEDGAWHSSRNVEFSVEIWDRNGSGVDGTTVEYALSTEGPFDYSFWVPVWVEPGAEFVNPSLDYKFQEGADNYVKWRAKDMAGNGFVESPPVNIKIDTTYIDFAEELTEQVAWYKNRVVTTGIYVRDLGSGINLSSFQVRISTEGSTAFGEWMPVDVRNISEADIENYRAGSTGLSTDDWDDEGAYRITATFAYAEGVDNYIMFRGTDLVGNPFGSSEKFNLKIDTSPVYFGLFSPGEDEYANKQEVECFIEIMDDGSGVDPATVEYSVAMGAGGDSLSFGAWKTVLYVSPGKPTQVSLDIEFDWGRNNFIRWRADDIIGSGHNISPSYRIWVNSDPEPEISSPKDGFSSFDDVEILFDASNSTDLDGDALNFTWYTNLSGDVPLSTEVLFRGKLTPGHHLITLHVDDGHGNNMTSEIKVNVKPRADEGGDLFGFSSDSTVLWIIICLFVLVLIAVVLIFIFVVRKKRDKDGNEQAQLPPPGSPVPPQGTPMEQERFHPPLGDHGEPRSFPPPQDYYATAPGVSTEMQTEMLGPLPELTLSDHGEAGQLALPAAADGQPVESAALSTDGTSPGAADLVSHKPAEKEEPVPAKTTIKKRRKRVVKKPMAEMPKKTPSIGEALEAWSLDFEEKTSGTKPSAEPTSENVQPSSDVVDTGNVDTETVILDEEKATPAEAAASPEDVAVDPKEEVKEVVLTCHSCSGDYAASITELPIIVVCPHCSAEGQIDSL